MPDAYVSDHICRNQSLLALLNEKKLTIILTAKFRFCIKKEYEPFSSLSSKNSSWNCKIGLGIDPLLIFKLQNIIFRIFSIEKVEKVVPQLFFLSQIGKVLVHNLIIPSLSLRKEYLASKANKFLDTLPLKLDCTFYCRFEKNLKQK